MSLMLQDHNSSARMSLKFNENKVYFDWDLYIQSFVSLISVASSIEEYEEIANSALDTLLNHDCEDIVRSSRLIDFIAVFRNSGDSENSVEAASKRVIEGESARQKAEDFHECVQLLNAKNFIIALRRSDSRLLQLFMKYGINVLAVDQDTEKEEIMRILRRFCYYSLRIERVIDGMELATDEEVFFTAELLADMFYSRISRGMGPEDHTRLMQIMFGVEAVLRMQRRDGTHREYVECVRLYFRGISWPFISTSEVRYIFRMFGKEKHLYAESLCRDFREIFPEFPKTPHEPRSLKEMCRAEVRDIMTFGQPTKTLPVAVSALCIPHTLKDYILGEEW